MDVHPSLNQEKKIIPIERVACLTPCKKNEMFRFFIHHCHYHFESSRDHSQRFNKKKKYIYKRQEKQQFSNNVYERKEEKRGRGERENNIHRRRMKNSRKQNFPFTSNIFLYYFYF